MHCCEISKLYNRSKALRAADEAFKPHNDSSIRTTLVTSILVVLWITLVVLAI